MIYIFITDALASAGEDQYGRAWIPVEKFQDQPPIHCIFCDKVVTIGWMCMDGGEEICVDHMAIREPWLVYQLQQEQKEQREFHNLFRELEAILVNGVLQTVLS
jgi:hypothetical protein